MIIEVMAVTEKKRARSIKDTAKENNMHGEERRHVCEHGNSIEGRHCDYSYQKIFAD